MSSNILLVEDDPALSFLIGDRLQMEGYAVSAVPDGEQALALVGTEDFDALLLDVMLPVKDGHAVCRELRASGFRTPILMFLAALLVCASSHAFAQGAPLLRPRLVR